MAWRAARSLTTLQAELDRAYPSRTKPDWLLGDASHAASASDHNPTSAGVVCAIDIRQGGIDLGAVAEHIKRTNHTAVKYVIYNRRIWSKARDAEGWRHYGGSNPHTTHIHVSVGVGPDGRSTGPYDSTASWGISGTGGGDDNMSFLGYGKGDQGPHIQDLQKYLDDCGYPSANSFANDKWDGQYGPGVAAAVLKCRKDNGSEATSGNKIDYWANNQLRRAHAKAMIKKYA